MIKFEPKEGFERLAFAVVLHPDMPNVYGDFHTKESVKQFAYGFMINGFGIDRDHDNVDITDGVRIVESFIVDEGDNRDFPVGSWVVGIYVLDDDLWSAILSGDINGFSYEALVSTLGVTVGIPEVSEVYGNTFPSIDDGHTHEFWARLDDNGRVIAGGTIPDDSGHDHIIYKTTYTEYASDDDQHRHRYSLLNNIEVSDNEAA